MSSIIDPSDIWALVENSIASISATQDEQQQIEEQLQKVGDEGRWSIARIRRMKRKVAAMRVELEEEGAIDFADGESKDAA